MDDLREGKMTLLIEKSLQNSNPDNKNIINDALGNHSLTTQQHKIVQDIIVKSGALNILKTEANDNINSAITSLNKLTGISDKNRDFIINIALYIKNRAS